MSATELQAWSIIIQDGSMTKYYRSVEEAAAYLGMSAGAFRSLKKQPKPDVVIGLNTRRPTRGYLDKTLDEYNAERPGKGNWGPRDSAKKATKKR